MANTESVETEEESSTKKVLAGCFILVYALAFVIYNIWFIASGGLNRPVSELLSFFASTSVDSQVFSWEGSVLVGFVLLKLWIAIAVLILLRAVLKKEVETNLKIWKKLLDLGPIALPYRMLGMVSAEELVFRWFPLAILYPLWGTGEALWTMIIVSTLVFALLHVRNQEEESRDFTFTLSQFLGGLILCYVFLAYGLIASIAVHFIYNAVLIVPIKVVWSSDPTSDDEAKE